MIVILWNHDLNKNKKLDQVKYDLNWNIIEKPNSPIFNLFKVKVFYIVDENNTRFIFTHYPIGYFNIENNNKLPFFEKLDHFIQENYIKNSNKNIVNIHGHTHSKDFNLLDNIFYVNACMDKLINDFI